MFDIEDTIKMYNDVDPFHKPKQITEPKKQSIPVGALDGVTISDDDPRFIDLLNQVTANSIPKGNYTRGIRRRLTSHQKSLKNEQSPPIKSIGTIDEVAIAENDPKFIELLDKVMPDSLPEGNYSGGILTKLKNYQSNLKQQILKQTIYNKSIEELVSMEVPAWMSAQHHYQIYKHYKIYNLSFEELVDISPENHIHKEIIENRITTLLSAFRSEHLGYGIKRLNSLKKKYKDIRILNVLDELIIRREKLDKEKQEKSEQLKKIKEAKEAGFRKIYPDEYGGEQVHIGEYVLVKNPERALSKTQWWKEGFEIQEYAIAHAIKKGKHCDYEVYRSDQVMPRSEESMRRSESSKKCAEKAVATRRANHRKKMEEEYEAMESAADEIGALPGGKIVQLYMEGYLNKYEATYAAFIARYRHQFTNYDQLWKDPKIDDSFHGLSYDERLWHQEYLREELAKKAKDSPIPKNWEKYLAKYDFETDVAIILSKVLQEIPHPKWFKLAEQSILQTIHEGESIDLEKLTYDKIKEYIKIAKLDKDNQ